MYRSLTEVLFALPEDTTVWPGHDYNGRSHSSIGAEKAGNARVAGKTLAEFKAIMDELHLPKPRRLEEAVPANRSSGLRHDAGAPGGQPQDSGPMQPRPAQGYAGDVTPQLAFDWWQKGEAVLVDVRSDAEREWVGFVPGAVPLAWKQWPEMALNAGFEEGIKAAVPTGKKAVLFCRSGVRSIAAARCASELGIEAYNILEGFEGEPDENAHRGRRGGWRFRGLPWRQG
jgi:sulfur dioxygenase